MRRATPERLRDILDAADAIQRNLPASRADFDQDEVMQAAQVRWVEIIGEAAHHVEPEVRAAYPDVPWKQVIGMRHHVTHGYYDVDHETLWNAITTDVPQLAEQIRTILAALGEQPAS